MSRRLGFVIMAIAVVLVMGFFAARYVTDATPSQAYATYRPPTADAALTDQQRIRALHKDVGNAAAEMAQLQEMATRLQLGRMKSMGEHLQEVADDLQPRLEEIEDQQARVILAEAIEGLRIVGQGSADLDPDTSMRGVNQVLESFEAMNKLNAS